MKPRATDGHGRARTGTTYRHDRHGRHNRQPTPNKSQVRRRHPGGRGGRNLQQRRCANGGSKRKRHQAQAAVGRPHAPSALLCMGPRPNLMTTSAHHAPHTTLPVAIFISRNKKYVRRWDILSTMKLRIRFKSYDEPTTNLCVTFESYDEPTLRSRSAASYMYSAFFSLRFSVLRRIRSRLFSSSALFFFCCCAQLLLGPQSLPPLSSTCLPYSMSRKGQLLDGGRTGQERRESR